jgi:hypothetical protein
MVTGDCTPSLDMGQRCSVRLHGSRRDTLRRKLPE